MPVARFTPFVFRLPSSRFLFPTTGMAWTTKKTKATKLLQGTPEKTSKLDSQPLGRPWSLVEFAEH
jgi:hypothetical protein